MSLPSPPGLLGPASLDPSLLPLPKLGYHAACGFPSPAEDHMDEPLDLNQRCVRNPVATFFVEADTGTSMVDLGIFPGDTLVVDRSLAPRSGDIVMALWEGGYTIKQFRRRNGRFELHSGNPEIAPIVVPADEELEVWGVVTWSFRKHVRR